MKKELLQSVRKIYNNESEFDKELNRLKNILDMKGYIPTDKDYMLIKSYEKNGLIEMIENEELTFEDFKKENLASEFIELIGKEQVNDNYRYSCLSVGLRIFEWSDDRERFYIHHDYTMDERDKNNFIIYLMWFFDKEKVPKIFSNWDKNNNRYLTIIKF